MPTRTETPQANAASTSPPALILAAGRGERMRPLTDTCPKPLLAVRGQPLLMWHVQALLNSGCRHLVFNTAWLGHQISSFFEPYRTTGNGFSLSRISQPENEFRADFSDEQADFGGALETAGGMSRALPKLFAGRYAGPQSTGVPPMTLDDAAASDAVFWLVAGDVFVPGFAFDPASVARFRSGTALAHLWLVPNPAHNPRGDFGLSADGRALNLPASDATTPRHTYSTLALIRAELLSPPWCDMPPGNPAGVKAPLAPLLRRAMDAGRVTAELYRGEWTDVGTPQRLAALNA